MWNDYKSQDIVGNNRIIDKLELVNNFLDGKNCKDIPLTGREFLRRFLRNNVKARLGEKKSYIPGVYCIYNENCKTVYHVGQSKNLKTRVREQLIGTQDRKEGILKFPRLFFAFIKTEYDGMKEINYIKLHPSEKKKYVESFQNFIFKSNNSLRICFTDDHLKAYVLEQTLIKYFRKKGQCKYDLQVSD